MIEAPDSALVHVLVASPNFGVRAGDGAIDCLILHYTGMASCAGAIAWLADPASKVSCHYVVDVDGRITQMVAERDRAWHAGVSYWQGERDLNSRSIGIEIHNPGHDLGYPPFPEPQIAAVMALARDILDRNGIRSARVLAHSDIAPLRKADPGERFPWERLAGEGLGDWVDPVAVDPADAGIGIGAAGPVVADMQSMLARYGYEAPLTGTLDRHTEAVVKAFQRRFRPGRVDGRIDASTIETLRRLLGFVAAA